MISVTPFKREDILRLDKPLETFLKYPNLINDIANQAESINSIAFTIWKDEKAIGILIGTIVWGYLCDITTLMCEGIKSCRFEFVRQCKSLLKYFEKHFGVKRFQMSISTEFCRAERFAQFLGFEKEGCMKYYGADRTNYYLYARII